MDRRRVVLARHAERDLLRLGDRFADQIADDLELLESPPWPPGKVKKLHGCDLWEIKTGDYRSIFWPTGKIVVVLRIVNRRDLEKAIGRIDVPAIERWLEKRERSE